MDATWIVTGNAGRTRIFAQAQGAASLEKIDERVNEAARARTADTETDGLGRRGSSTGLPRSGTPSTASGYEPHQTPAEHQTERFARDVAAFLLQSHQQGRFRELALVASPEFLGVLRKALDPTLTRVVGVTIDKDYSQDSGAQLQEHLAKHRAKT